ncbi:uncharacterized protein TNCV_3807541 [Trichonephila clavipes]|nr:uncharacterized protein TNCV_3807541 [Trichonephila clavipes]
MWHDSVVYKIPLSACLAWMLSEKFNLKYVSDRQSSGVSLWGGNWVTKLPTAFGIRLYDAALKRDTRFQGRYNAFPYAHGIRIESIARRKKTGQTEWLATLTTLPLVLGSNLGDDMDVCKWIVPSRNGGTLNSHRAASPLVRLVEEEKRWEAPDHPQSILPQNWGETE